MMMHSLTCILHMSVKYGETNKLWLENFLSYKISNFKHNDHSTDALYHSNKILKITDYIGLLNFMFAKNALARGCLSNFRGAFRLANNTHHLCTRHAAKVSVILKNHKNRFMEFI